MTQHDATLRKAGLPTVETLTRRILTVWRRATPSDIEAGATWYDDARELALRLGSESGYYEAVGVEAAAAVIAHLSPRTTWTRNVVAAISLISSGERADGIMSTCYERALASLEFADPADSFGPAALKTQRFYRNILGDTESVTVDVWAARVAGVNETQLKRKGVYAAVECAYQRAARRAGVEPATMQATTWVVARGGRAS